MYLAMLVGPTTPSREIVLYDSFGNFQFDIDAHKVAEAEQPFYNAAGPDVRISSFPSVERRRTRVKS